MTKDKILKFAVGMMIFGLVLQVGMYIKNRAGITAVSRPETGEDDIEITMRVKGDDFNEEITFTLDEEKPEDREVTKLLEQAKEEAMRDFLGENSAFDWIQNDVVLKENYLNQTVQAQWKFEPEGIVSKDGSLMLENVKEDTTVTCTLELGAYEKQLLYTFPIVVKKPDIHTTGGVRFFIMKALEEENQKSANQEEMILPQAVGDLKLQWMEPVSYVGFQICFVGIIGGILLLAAQKIDERKKEEEKKTEFVKDYPDIVSALVLYMGAGMSIQGAFSRIGENYKRKKASTNSRKPAYENILVLNRGLSDGRDVKDLFEEFGKNSHHPAYKKLSLLLVQNLRKGNEYLLEQLEKEEQNLYEERQRKQKTAGEEASMKLLLPLGGLLIMVLIIVVVPAFFRIQI